MTTDPRSSTLPMTRFALAHVAGAVCAMMTLLGVHALADQNAATDGVPRLLPYHGQLKFQGAPVDARGAEAPWMRFELYDEATPVFAQDIQVDVSHGEFTALLGPTDSDGTSLEQIIRDADDLTLSITLLNDPANDADDLPMSNQQRLAIRPYAIWATHGLNFVVGNDLQVAGDMDIASQLRTNQIEELTSLNPSGNTLNTASPITVGGDYRVAGDTTIAMGSTTVGGDATLNGPLNTTGLAATGSGDIGGTLYTSSITVGNVNANTSPGTVTIGGGATVNGVTYTSSGANAGIVFPSIATNASDNASIRYVGNNNNATELQISVGNDPDDDIEFYADDGIKLEINDTYGLYTSANVWIGGPLTGGNLACRTSSCYSALAVDDGAVGNGDWQNWIMCPANEFACGLSQKIDNDGDHAGVTLYRLYCCPF